MKDSKLIASFFGGMKSGQIFKKKGGNKAKNNALTRLPP